MFLQSILLYALAVLNVTFSLPIEDKIDPVELFYRCVDPEADEGEKSPVLLLHSLLTSHRTWEDLLEILPFQTKRKACVVDLRNHGNSPWHNRSDIASLAVDIGNFLDKQNITKVNLIGQSLGGKIAMHYTLNNPSRVDSIIVEEMRPNNVKRAPILMISFFARFLQRMLSNVPEGLSKEEAIHFGIQSVNKTIIELGTVEKLPQNAEKLAEIKQVDGKWQLKHNMPLILEALKNPRNFWTKSSGVYTGPTLFIYGTESPFKVYEDKENIHKLFPRAEFAAIEGAGHILHENFREFDDIVIKFLNGIN